MGSELLKEDRERRDGSEYIYWSIGSVSGEAWTDADAWEAMARALAAERDAATARAKAAEQRAEAAEAELQQARADARLILAAFVGANAEGVIEYRMTNADRDAIDVLIESVYDTLEDSLLVTTIRRVASIPDNPQETSETSGSITE